MEGNFALPTITKIITKITPERIKEHVPEQQRGGWFPVQATSTAFGSFWNSARNLYLRPTSISRKLSTVSTGSVSRNYYEGGTWWSNMSEDNCPKINREGMQASRGVTEGAEGHSVNCLQWRLYPS